MCETHFIFGKKCVHFNALYFRHKRAEQLWCRLVLIKMTLVKCILWITNGLMFANVGVYRAMCYLQCSCHSLCVFCTDISRLHKETAANDRFRTDSHLWSYRYTGAVTSRLVLNRIIVIDSVFHLKLF